MDKWKFTKLGLGVPASEDDLQTMAYHLNLITRKYKMTIKSVPLQAWSGPEGYRKLRFPRFHDNGTGRW